MRASLTAASLALAATLAAPAFAQETAPVPQRVASTVDRLVEKANSDDVGLQFVEDLTTEVGQRLAGSEAEARARAWAEAELKSLGFRNVRTEAFEIPYWSRVTESAQIVSPAPQALVLTALCGSAATPEGGPEAGLVRLASLADPRPPPPHNATARPLPPLLLARPRPPSRPSAHLARGVCAAGRGPPARAPPPRPGFLLHLQL